MILYLEDVEALMETLDSGWSLDQEGVYVTSRSGALSKLILWGHLLASDLDYYAIKTLDFDYEALWVDAMLF